MQAVLDTVLARAGEEVKSRFGMLLAANGDGVQYAQPGAEVLAELGGATLAAPAPVPQRLDPEAIGRLPTILMEYVKIDNERVEIKRGALGEPTQYRFEDDAWTAGGNKGKVCDNGDTCCNPGKDGTTRP